MKAVSWNVFNLADDLEAFRNFVQSADADVLALQELTGDHIRVLESLPGYRVFQAEDFIEDDILTHLVIATRLPASDHAVIAHNPDRLVSGSILGRRMRWIECLNSQAVTVSFDGAKVRIANLHLSCGVSPQIRMRQLEEASTHIAGVERALVCGDFNSYANPLLNLLVGRFLGFRVTDIFVDEIKRLDAFARAYDLARVFDRVVTHPRYRLHLDHMFVRGLAVQAAHVEVDTHGSDHLPIVAELEL